MSPARLAAFPGAFYARLFGNATPRGVTSMILGMAAFVTNDTFTKLASATMPTGQLIVIRNITATILILALICLTGHAGQIRHATNRAVITRSAIDVIATLLYLLALFHMQIGNVTAINMATPLAMTAAAAAFLRAPVGWRRWSAVVVGFIGVLLIVQPRAEGFNFHSLSAIAAVVFIVARDLTTRSISAAVPSLMVTLTNAIFVLIGALALSLVEGWVAIGWKECALLFASGIFLICGYLLIVDAFRHGDLATVNPFRYTGLIWALTFGFIVWGDVPNRLAQIGIVIVVASGLYVLHRERLRSREEAVRKQPSA
ncbi:MAG TPA: DMT family transporter [Ferrovibrio sp.]|uniref:DMT family transporter n=1 Tax=Ferrovibrio sp. TaxID=1917215 RepID=UPI002ED657EF